MAPYRLHTDHVPRGPTLQFRGRRHAKHDGNRAALLLGAPLELPVRTGNTATRSHEVFFAICTTAAHTERRRCFHPSSHQGNSSERKSPPHRRSSASSTFSRRT